MDTITKAYDLSYLMPDKATSLLWRFVSVYCLHTGQNQVTSGHGLHRELEKQFLAKGKLQRKRE